MKSTDSGETWQTATRLTNNTGFSCLPNIAVSGTNIYVVWEDTKYDANNEILIRKSMDSGASWPTATRLTNNVGDSCYSHIAIRGTKVYVVWADNTPGNYEIFLKYSAY